MYRGLLESQSGKSIWKVNLEFSLAVAVRVWGRFDSIRAVKDG